MSTPLRAGLVRPAGTWPDWSLDSITLGGEDRHRRRALLISGLPLRDKLASFPPTVQIAYLNKPASRSRLLEAVYRLLNDAGEMVSTDEATRKPS